jgi:hypothetical protein
MCWCCETVTKTTVREFAKEHFKSFPDILQEIDECRPPHPREIAKEIDLFSPTKINNGVVFRMVKRGLYPVWYKLAIEDPQIPFELELAHRLLEVYDSEVAARSLVIGWWDKHEIPHDEAKLDGVVARAMTITSASRARYRKIEEKKRAERAERQAAKYAAQRAQRGDRRKTETTSKILEVLNNGVLSRLQLSTLLPQFSGTQIQNALYRLQRSGLVVKAGHGLYELATSTCLAGVPV